MNTPKQREKKSADAQRRRWQAQTGGEERPRVLCRILHRYEGDTLPRGHCVQLTRMTPRAVAS